jgi:hypothetical protein
MVRIFLSLAILSLTLLATTLVVGLLVGDLTVGITEETLRFKRMHFLLGVLSALVVVLVNSIGVTYFIGTSRWCKEVVETYKLDRNLVARSTQLKRRAFPWALCGMLTIVGVISLGAASDPVTKAATGIEDISLWRDFHFAAALAGAAIIGWSYFMLWTKINANQAIIADVMHEVKQVRDERGLE